MRGISDSDKLRQGAFGTAMMMKLNVIYMDRADLKFEVTLESV